MTSLEILTWLQLVVLLPLAALGLHRGWLALRLVVGPPGSRDHTPKPTADEAELPTVTVQLPIFNERFVVERLIQAVAALDYPRDRLEIQVLDDSTDDTGQVVEQALRKLPDDLHAVHLRRSDREHFKAGALAAGLAQASGEFIAMFDADFVPRPDFLRRTIPHFAEPQIGMVQARWEHRNADHSTLTRVQALLLDGHFAVEHVARSRAGCFFNFNGTAGVFRRRCIDEAGGWQGDTLTEDMDLSYRAQLAGWRFAYLPDVDCPAELPTEVNAFLSQQHRWAKGSIQTARKLLGSVLRADLPLRVKAEACFHLLGNLAFPCLLALILLALPVQILRWMTHADIPSWLAWVEGLPLLAATVSVLTYYGVSQVALGRSGLATWFRLPLVLAAGAGLSLNNTAAVASGFAHDPGVFHRTPKHRTDSNDTRRRYPARRGGSPVREIFLGTWALTTSVLALQVDLLATAAFHALFAGGLLWLGGTSWAEGRDRTAASAMRAKTP